MRLQFGTIFMASMAIAASAMAASYQITNDTYIDSYYLDGISNADRRNFGHSGAIKAVSNDGDSTTFPGASIVRGLFTLPNSFWTDLGTEEVLTATVTYYIRNNSLDDAHRIVELRPLTRSFVAGGGGNGGSTQAGTLNSELTEKGADWFTYDGVNAWAEDANGNPIGGGLFDAGHAITTTGAVGLLALQWDIAPLLNDSAARADPGERPDVETRKRNPRDIRQRQSVCFSVQL